MELPALRTESLTKRRPAFEPLELLTRQQRRRWVEELPLELADLRDTIKSAVS